MRGLAQRLDERRLAWLLLGVAMSISATWLLIAGRDLAISGDGVFYYARLVNDNGVVGQSSGLEYFLAPHNGHLQVMGKLIYRGLFLTVGADYLYFRIMEIAAVFLSVLIFFLLMRRRVRPLAALIPSVLLLFFGYAEQSFLWAFSIHTIGALLFGLAALLALERGDRRGDLLACGLLVLSIATVEVGLAFAVAVAITVMLREDRWRRAWIFAVPVGLFAIWWLWARQYGQSEVELLNLRLIPLDFTSALAALAGSIFGINPAGPGVDPNVTTVTEWGAVLGAVGVFGLGYRISRGNVPPLLWAALAAILTYWLMITLADRPPDSTRYLFVGAVAVFLIAAAALRGRRLSGPMLIGAAVVVALAIPQNIAKFYDARASSVLDAENTRTQYAMLELARDELTTDYFPAEDPRVSEAGGHIFVPLSADTYLAQAEEFGSLAYSLEEIRELDLDRRQVADATLVGALQLRPRPTAPPPDPSACPRSLDGTQESSVFFELPEGGVQLGSLAERPVRVSVGRFARGGPGIPLGRLAPGEWAGVEIPSDPAPDPWWAVVDGPVYVCPVAGEGG